MKKIFPLVIVIALVSLCFTSQTFVSCVKEKTVYDTVTVNHHDTTIVNHHDTTIVYGHDTIQLTLESCCNNFETTVDSYYPTGNSDSSYQLAASAWTHDGSPENTRIYTTFNYSDLPSTPIIINARLFLYAIPTPGAGNFTDAHFGTANACYVQRITSAWQMSTINWNNQPATTTTNQAIIPQSTSSFQNDTINVTDLVKDMISTNNYGFAISLQNEAIYNSRQYCSSFYVDETKRPKLVIQYKKQ